MNDEFNIAGYSSFTRRTMSDQSDLAKIKRPGAMTMRQLRKLAKRSAVHDLANGKAHNKLAQKSNRWQRSVRYVWDKKKG